MSDVLRVAVEGGVVKYALNGTILYTSSTPPRYPLVTDTSLYSSGAKVQDATMGGELKEIVSWTHLDGVRVKGDALVRDPRGPRSRHLTTAEPVRHHPALHSCLRPRPPMPGGWTAGAISSRRIAGGNGGAEYRVSIWPTYVMFGLSHGDTDGGYADIDFALFTCPATGEVMVFEGGAYRGTFGSYAAGDVLAVAIEDGAVSYRRNGALLYTSSAAPVYPLVLDLSLYWGRIEGARLFGNVSSVPEQAVTWSNLVNVTDAGGTLRRPTGYGWDAGAVSTQTLVGDGYAEYTVSCGTEYVMFGLGNGDSDQGYTDIEYAIFTVPGEVARAASTCSSPASSVRSEGSTRRGTSCGCRWKGAR